MRVISRSRLRAFWDIHAQARSPLEEWYAVVSRAQWRNLDDLHHVYPSADQVAVESGRTITVFNIGGNKFRLIAAIHYNTQTIFILGVMTHSEYTRENWKKRL